MDLSNVDSRMLICIGAATLGVFIWFIKWFVETTLDSKVKKLEEANLEEKKELEQDQYITLKGQQVTNNCLHELIYAAINGTHNGSLELVNDELNEYRELVDQNLVKKAAKWSSKKK
jgi:hypothetical protein